MIRRMHHFFKTSHGYIILSLCCIIACGIIGYGHTLNYSFHFDDAGDIVDNPAIRNISAFGQLWSHAPERFLAMVSFAMNYTIHEFDVVGYHIVNIIIHIVTVIAIGAFSWLLLASPKIRHPNKNQIALIVALLFVAHPLHVQAVTYIVQRMASMATMFYMLSLVFYAYSRQIARSITRRRLLIALSILSSICAMFTKQISFTLPIAVLLYEVCFLQPNLRSIFHKRGLIILIPSLILILIIPALSGFNLGLLFRTIEPQQGHEVTLNGFNYLLTQFRVIVTYIRLLILPINQNLDYDYPIYESITNPNVMLSFFLLTTMLVLALQHWNRHRIAAFGVLWFFLTLSVESSIIPIPNVIFEHRMYLPSFGLLLAGTYLLFNLRSTRIRKYVPAILASAIVVLLIATIQRNKVWENDWTLWNDVVQKSPNKARPWNNRGKYSLDQQNYKAAIADFNKSIRINPRYFHPKYNRGVALQKLGYLDKALHEFNGLIEDFPKSYETYNSRGCIYLVHRKFNKALHDLSLALTLKPDFIDALNNRAVLYLQTSNVDQAMQDFKEILTQEPRNPEALINFSLAHMQQQNYTIAIHNFSTYLSNHPPTIDVYLSRGKSYLKTDKYKNALSDFNNALRMNPKQARSWHYRGIAHFKLNHLKNAKNDYHKALALDKHFSETYYQLALVNAKLDRVNDALSNLDMLLTLKPGHQHGLAQKKRLLASQIKKN